MSQGPLAATLRRLDRDAHEHRSKESDFSIEIQVDEGLSNAPSSISSMQLGKSVDATMFLAETV